MMLRPRIYIKFYEILIYSKSILKWAVGQTGSSCELKRWSVDKIQLPSYCRVCCCSKSWRDLGRPGSRSSLAAGALVKVRVTVVRAAKERATTPYHPPLSHTAATGHTTRTTVLWIQTWSPRRIPLNFPQWESGCSRLYKRVWSDV